MSGITSGIGLISGLNIQSIVDQLIAVEARPRDLLTARIGRIDAQRTAYLDVSARITALLNRVSALRNRSAFTASTATSSNPDVLSVTPGAATRPGSATFIVRSLAAAHQLVSGGFQSLDATLPPGSLTIESAAARVDRRTTLAELNGFAGVQRGRFEIEDASGARRTIDVSDARTLGDVVERINAAGINIRAAVRGDSLTLAETSGGALRIRELDGGRTAADLGFAAGNTTGNATLTGRDLLYLSDGTPLSALNDGNGLRRGAGGSDFRIQASDLSTIAVDLSGILKVDTRLERLNDGQGVTLGRIAISTRDGRRTEVDLAGLRTAGEVESAIEAAVSGVSVTLTGGKLVLADNSTVPQNPDGSAGTPRDFVVEDLDGGTTARQLGIAGRAATASTASATTLSGRSVLRVDTLRAAVAAINFATNNNGAIVASIAPEGDRLILTDVAGGSGRLVLENIEGSGSQALADLGLQPGDYGRDGSAAGRRILGGIDTVMLSTLRGGRGLGGGTIQIDAGGGATLNVDLTAAETLADVVSRINAAAESAGIAITAGYDRNGTRLALQRTDGGPGPLAVTDVSGTFAADSGLTQSASGLTSANLQRRYINENTRLASLNAGAGVTRGQFRITDSLGRSATVDLSVGTIETLQNVIDEINASGVGARARINDNGDGLVIEDTAGGTFALKVEDVSGGTTARSLNILGESASGAIDGSFEFTYTTAAGETLGDLVARINARNSLATAATLNDGGSVNPFRLNLTARATGLAGELLVDTAGLGVDFSTLSRARDATVIIGDDPASGVVVSSASNTLENVVNGLTLNLTSVSDDPVTVTVGRDTGAVVSALRGMVDDFNAVMERIKALSSFNPETERGGALLGDGALQLVESRLFRLFSGTLAGASGEIRRLSAVGVRLGDGARLTLDEERLRAALEQNEEAVVEFFTNPQTGLAAKLKSELERITERGGLINRRTRGLETQREQITERIDQLNSLLGRKRTRLLRQFQAMEEALSRLQSQQNALSNFAAGTAALQAR